MPTEYDPRADYYAILGIDVSATAAEIKKAHRARIAEIHPDRGGDGARAAAVNVARDVLGDASTRRAYDHARREWLLQALESPFVSALVDPDGRLAASLATQAAAAQTGTQGRTAAAPPP